MAVGQDSAYVRQTNLELFRMMAGEIAGTSFMVAPPVDTLRVQLNVIPRESGWVIEDRMAQVLRQRGARIVTAGGMINAEFGVLRMQVIYENIRRDGIFGPKVVDRDVVVTLHARMVDIPGGSVLISEDVRRDHRDTVLVAEIDRLESPTLPATHGVLPAEGLLQNLAEPLILLGAVGVAVVLLFTVRS